MRDCFKLKSGELEQTHDSQTILTRDALLKAEEEYMAMDEEAETEEDTNKEVSKFRYSDIFGSISEPPHLSQFFSSYVYESSTLDDFSNREKRESKEDMELKKETISKFEQQLVYSTKVDDMSQSQNDFAGLVVEDSELDHQDNCISRLRKPIRKETYIMTTDEELTHLRNRVKYLEDLVGKLCGEINRLSISNGNNGL